MKSLNTLIKKLNSKPITEQEEVDIVSAFIKTNEKDREEAIKKLNFEILESIIKSQKAKDLVAEFDRSLNEELLFHERELSRKVYSTLKSLTTAEAISDGVIEYLMTAMERVELLTFLKENKAKTNCEIPEEILESCSSLISPGVFNDFNTEADLMRFMFYSDSNPKRLESVKKLMSENHVTSFLIRAQQQKGDSLLEYVIRYLLNKQGTIKDSATLENIISGFYFNPKLNDFKADAFKLLFSYGNFSPSKFQKIYAHIPNSEFFQLFAERVIEFMDQSEIVKTEAYQKYTSNPVKTKTLFALSDLPDNILNHVIFLNLLRPIKIHKENIIRVIGFEGNNRVKRIICMGFGPKLIALPPSAIKDSYNFMKTVSLI